MGVTQKTMFSISDRLAKFFGISGAPMEHNTTVKSKQTFFYKLGHFGINYPGLLITKIIFQVLRMHMRGLNTSNRGSKKSALKLTSGMVGVVGLGCGAMIGLCKFDPSFRPMIEENVPLSSFVLSLALDENEEKKIQPAQAFPGY